jgi:exosome complex RNA-binding protein Rrp42 (RNase PH superfamily)
MKYGSRCRIAVDDSGKIVGFAMFDNEINQELIADATEEEAELYVKSRPFIFIQLLIVDPSADPEKKWSGRLIASVQECIIKNRKVAIVRTKADDEAEIQLYKSCGFYTMEDMQVPSYSALKDNVAILAYTPLGLEQTAAIFQRFYSSGARF